MAARVGAARRDAARAPVDVAIAGWVCASERARGWVAVEVCDASPVAFGALGADAVDAGPIRVRVVEGLETPGGSALAALRRGHAVRLRVALRPDRPLSNPGAPDRAAASRRRGIGAKARLVDAALVARVPELDRERLLAWVLDARERVGARVGDVPGGALLRALATGDRVGLSRAQRDAFAKLGIGHLLAVSGLHLTLVAGLAFAAARGALVRVRRLAERRDVRPIALALAVAAAVAYAALAGWGVPVKRALACVCVVAARLWLGRAASAPHALALAAIAVLYADPAALFAPGAQLSFAATAALLVALEPDARPTRGPGAIARVASFVASGLRVSALAIAATAPILAWHGMTVGAFGLVANAVAVPLTAFALLPASLVAAALAAAPLSDPAFAALVAPAATVAHATLASVEGLAAAAPGVPVGAVSRGGVAVAVALALAALAIRRTSVRVAIAAAIPFALALAKAAPVGPPPPRVVALDVGRGDALLVEGRSGAVLVDGGWAMPPRADLGRTAVVPALRALGVSRLDVVVASHADLDHRGGLETVLSELRVGELWLPFGGLRDPDFGALAAVAARRGVAVRERGEGDATRSYGDLHLTPLWPPRDAAAAATRNDRSLVVRAEVDGVRVLATGDVGVDAEARLVSRAAPGALRADVLKLAHHGSRSSSSPAFVAAVDPRVAIASAPCPGRGGLPTSEAISRARARGAAVWWTGRDGAVSASWSAGAPLVVVGRERVDRCALR